MRKRKMKKQEKRSINDKTVSKGDSESSTNRQNEYVGKKQLPFTRKEHVNYC